LAFNGGKTIKTQPLSGDGKLKTTTFLMSGLQPQSMDHKFDFVLKGGADTEEITVSMVRAIAMK
jgi:hypothetical protein